MNRSMMIVVILVLTSCTVRILANQLLPIDKAAIHPKQDAHEVIQGEPLTVEIVPTFGPGGGKRPKEYLVGDQICVTMFLSGLATTIENEVDLSIAFNLHDATDSIVANQVWHSERRVRPFLLSSVSCQIESPVLESTLSAGVYVVRITVRDNISNSMAEDHLHIVVLPKHTFGATHIRYTKDPDGNKPCGWCIPQESPIYLQLQLAKCMCHSGRISVISSCTAIRDDTSVAVGESMETILNGPYTDQPRRWIFADLSGLPPGRYTIVLRLEDQLAREEAEKNKTLDEETIRKTEATYRIPLLVVDPSWDHKRQGPK